MAIGDLFFALAGKPDPRQQLMQALAGGAAAADTSGTPAPAVSTPPAAGMDSGTAAPAAPATATPPTPEAYKSPPDLSKLYMDLLKREDANRQIDRGIGLIGASFAHPENKASILSAMGVGGGGSGSGESSGGDLLSSVVSLEKLQNGLMAQAQMRAALPSIAKRYNMDIDTVKYLFNSGKLDDVINELQKPNKQIVKDENGQNRIVDLNSGDIGDPFGTLKKPELEIKTDADGNMFAVDKNTGQRVGRNIAMGRGANTDIQNWNQVNVNREASGQPPISFEDYQLELKKAGANRTDVTVAGEKAWDTESAKLFAKRYDNITQAADNAQEMNTMYDAVEKALDSGLRTGTFGPQELQMRRFGQLLGLDTDQKKVSSGELVNAIGNRMALLMRSPESGMGMPGSLSDNDIRFLQQSNVGLTTSPEGNRDMIKVFKMLNDRKMKIASMADDYIMENGKLDSGFNKMVRDYANAHSLFDGFQFASPTGDVKAAISDNGIDDLVKKYTTK